MMLAPAKEQSRLAGIRRECLDPYRAQHVDNSTEVST